MAIKPMFIKKPPVEFSRKVLQSLGLKDESDGSWITPSTINNKLKQEVLEESRQYYYECYAKQFLDQPEINYARYITIANHFLKFAGICLEKKKNGHTKVLENKIHYFVKYRIMLKNKKGDFCVSFE